MPTLSWIGKGKVVNHHLDVAVRELQRAYTFGIDGATSSLSSENKIIHGDSLDALKSLLPQYEGRVKCIYLDPPYNTGNEGWVYNDNVNDPHIQKWLGDVVGKEGEDFSRHDKWLCMMYPRLKLVQKLLSDDGAVFISIDDNEQANLKLICDEIFGSGNFLESFIWHKTDSPSSNTVSVVSDHEYILCYCKNIGCARFQPMEAPEIVQAYGGVDENGRRCRDRLLKKNGANSLRKDRPTMFFPIVAPDGTEVYPIHDNGEEARWSMGAEGVKKLQATGGLVWKRRMRGGQEVWEPYTREYPPANPTRPYPTIWYDLHTMRQAKAMLRDIFNTSDLFDTPKPENLIARILRFVGSKDSIVLDCFAGSGTTAHAVLKANAEDGGNRHFILVEMCDYAESVTAERVKRVIKGYGEGKNAVAGTGGDFSFYEIGEPILAGDEPNPAASDAAIRDYVWFSETRSARPQDATSEPALLGVHFGTAYYYWHDANEPVILNRSLLHTIKTKAEAYVIYADLCAFGAAELEKFHITFKKVSRDIVRI